MLMDSTGSAHADSMSGRVSSELPGVWQLFAAPLLIADTAGVCINICKSCSPKTSVWGKLGTWGKACVPAGPGVH